MTTVENGKIENNIISEMNIEKKEIEDMWKKLEMSNIEIKNAKISQAILEWFDSWQMWQKKILITGIVNRFQYSQLRGLLMAVESVFHKDFTTTVRKIYPMPEDTVVDKVDEPIKKNTKLEKLLKPNTRTSVKDTTDKSTPQQNSGKNIENIEAHETAHEESNMRMRSPLIGSRSRTTSGSELTAEESHILSPIEETTTSEVEDNLVLPDSTNFDENQSHENLSGYNIGQQMPLISHLMNESPNMSQVSTLVSSLSPIEETSRESIAESVGSDDLDEIIPITKQHSTTEKEVKQPKIKEAPRHYGKVTKKRNIPAYVVKRIVSHSSLTARKVSSNFSLTPIGIQSEVTLDFRSSISSAKVHSDDFFDKINNNDLLGQPVTTRSKLGANYMEDYDFTRNRVPVPTRQQMYKNKKLWKRDTIETNVDRLKEQFREQLTQIWEWIDSWPAHRRSRLMIDLFSKSSEKMIKFAAECMKSKVDETDDAPAPINTLSDPLLYKIFDKLDLSDLLQVPLVCHRWYTMLNSDEWWMDKCNEIGLEYGISNLVELLASGAEVNQYLDWKQAFTEVEEYLTLNMGPELRKEQEEEEEDAEDSESDEESINKFEDYIPYWKLHPPGERRKKGAQTPVPAAAANKHVEEVDTKFRNTDIVGTKHTAGGSAIKDKKQLIGNSELGGSYAHLLAYEGMDEYMKQVFAETESFESFVNDEKVQGRTSPKKGGFLQMWKNITEDIKEDLIDDALSHTCEDLDILPDMQTWEDVELLTNIGKKFAVAAIIPDAMKACSKNWNIDSHISPVVNVKVLKGHQGGVNVVKAQGNRIFSGSSDRCVRVWDKNGDCFGKMHDGFKGGVNDISIGSLDDCHVMYTATWDMCIRAWNTNNFKLIGTMIGHNDSVSKVAADSRFIVSSSYDGTIKIWDRRTLRCEKTLTCHKGAVESMIYHDKMIISGGVDKLIHIHNASSGELIISYAGHHSSITALKKQHDLLASGDKHGMIYFWSLASKDSKHVDKVKAHESQINAIYMHGPTFFSASKDALIKEWDLVTMTTVRVFQGHTDSVTDVMWTEKFLLSASKDNDVRIWWWEAKENTSPKNSKIMLN